MQCIKQLERTKMLKNMKKWAEVGLQIPTTTTQSLMQMLCVEQEELWEARLVKTLHLKL